jgi:hypothetical protein
MSFDRDLIKLDLFEFVFVKETVKVFEVVLVIKVFRLRISITDIALVPWLGFLDYLLLSSKVVFGPVSG